MLPVGGTEDVGGHSGLPSLPLLVVATFALYLVALYVYRLFLHPLARFPGPKLAAATSWYEAYFEIVLKGQYTAQISRLHDQYGTPPELLLNWTTLVLSFSISRTWGENENSHQIFRY